MTILRNTSLSFLGTVLPVAVTLFTVPVYLHLVGLDRYGVLSICWAILGYFGFVDLGLGRAATQAIAAARQSSSDRIPGILANALWLNGALSLVGVLLLGGAAYALSDWLNFSSPGLQREFIESIPILALFIVLTTTSGVLTGALQGVERFGALTFTRSLSSVLNALGPLTMAAFYSIELPSLMIGMLMSKVFSTLVCVAFCRRELAVKRGAIFEPAVAKSLLSFGGWVTVTGLISPLMVTFDRIAIGATVGTAAVPLYSIPSDLLSRAFVLPNSLSAALFPRMSSVATVADAERLGRLALAWLSFVMTPVSFACLVVIEPFLRLWIGTAFANEAAQTAHVLVIGVWANALARIPFTSLLSRGRPDLIAKIHLAEIVPYLLLLYLSLTSFGIVGAAIAWTTRVLVDGVALMALSHFGLKAVARLLPALGVLIIAFLVGTLVPMSEPLRWVLLLLVGALVLVWAYYHRPADFQSQLDRLRRQILSRWRSR